MNGVMSAESKQFSAEEHVPSAIWWYIVVYSNFIADYKHICLKMLLKKCFHHSISNCTAQ